MSNAKWAKVDTSRVIPREVINIPGQVANLNTKINSAFELVATAIELIDNLSFTLTDPTTLSIKAALDAVSASLVEVSEGHRGTHYINIPICRTDQPPIAPITPAGSSAFSSFRLGDWLGSGGNLGFYNKVAQSLYDAGDLNRPQYNSTAFMSGFVVLAGANSTAALINSTQYLHRLIGTLADGMDGNIVPVPTNIRFRRVPLIATATAGERITTTHPDAPYAVHLSWDPVFPLARTEYGVSAFNIKRVSIYRNKVQDGLIDTTSQTQLDKTLYHRVEYSLKNFHFVDQNIEPDTEYYYAVGYTVEVVDLFGTRTQLKHEQLSSVVYVDTHARRSQLTTHAQGIPPDWQSLQSSLNLVPQLHDLVLRMSLYVEGLANSVGAVDSGLKQLSRGLKQLIATKELAIRELVRLGEALQGLLEPTLGIYSFAFSGKGGNGYFLDALYQALTDRTDTSRPPFDSGKEAVAGFIMLAGAGSAADLNGINTLASWFGATSGGVNTQNPYVEAGAGCPTPMSATASTSTDRAAGEEALRKLNLCKEEP